MSARQFAIVSEIENQRAMLATRAAQFAGEAADLREQLTAAKAETEAQRTRADAAEAKVAEMLDFKAKHAGDASGIMGQSFGSAARNEHLANMLGQASQLSGQH